MAWKQVNFGDLPIGTQFLTDHDAMVWDKMTERSAKAYSGRAFAQGEIMPFDSHEVVFIQK